MLKHCLVANRGEIAVRIIRACHALGIAATAVYSTADRHALHVELADHAVELGPPSPAESYLAIERLIDAARSTGCDCVHPGYGFLSESPDFAEAVLAAGLTWVGPPPAAIRAMGVKTEARRIMEAAGVPVVPGYQPEDVRDADYLTAAQRIGFPLMIKAAGGGGGKGIRIAWRPEDLEAGLSSASREAEKAFGDPRVFLEWYIERGRHIEVQVLADRHGKTVHLFDRECSAQRRHQKIVEESPSPMLNAQQREEICMAAVRAAQAVGYVNAGTVEFIASQDGQFYFLEMNTRLQVEHPVTESVTGLDLVELQFLIAGGLPIPFEQSDVTQRGHAIECRVYAEDAQRSFLPSIGTLHTLDMPAGPGIRIDSGVRAGDAVTIHYDPMIAKIIAYAPTRDGARRKLLHALRQMVVLGVTTNVRFLIRLLDDPVFAAGKIDTTYVDANLRGLIDDPESGVDAAVLIALALSEAGASAPVDAAASQRDPYSPWARPDGFRLHD